MPDPLTVDIDATLVDKHYENFPVASWLVPAKLRPAILAVYRFARFADDIADEGEHTREHRLAELARLRQALTPPDAPAHPIIAQLAPSIDKHRLPRQLLLDLLTAFEQDAGGTEFPDRSALLAYCSHSANPVGRLVLRIFDCDQDADLAKSDAICSALQLINFLQDVGQDYQRGRIYIPGVELQEAGLSPNDLSVAVANRRASPALKRLLEQQALLARTLLLSGVGLLATVPFRLRLELAAIIAGGLSTLRRLQFNDPFAQRIKLGASDIPVIAWHWVRLLLTPRK